MTVYMTMTDIPALENLSIIEFFQKYYYSSIKPDFKRNVENVNYLFKCEAVCTK